MGTTGLEPVTVRLEGGKESLTIYLLLWVLNYFSKPGTNLELYNSREIIIG